MGQRVSVEMDPDTKRVDITLPQELSVPSSSSAPAVLIEQARMLVQVEEQRFAAQQSQATTLLAVVGVISSIGAGLLAVLDGRDFKLHVTVFGLSFSLVLIAALVVGFFGVILGLLQAGQSALGIMQQKPDPAPEKLTPFVKDQFPEMLDGDEATVSRTLLSSMAGQLRAVQEANERISVNLKLVASRLARVVISGLALAILMLAGTGTHPQKVQLVNGDRENAVAVKGTR